MSRRRKRRTRWITMDEIENEIFSVLKNLQTETHGRSLEGKAMAATIAGTYLFEFWKRTRSPQMTLKKAQVKAMEAMHQKIMAEERQEDLKALEGELKEADDVIRLAKEKTNEGEAQGGDEGPDTASDLDSSAGGEAPVVEHAEAPEGQPTEPEDFISEVEQGEAPARERPESSPLTILPADDPVGMGKAEEVKDLRELTDEELEERVARLLRSQSEATKVFDGTDRKEVKSSNRPKEASLGTPNMSLQVGRKPCVNCNFELPGYETICVACKAHQPKIVKPT